MTSQTIKCLGCKTEAPMSVSMYFDSGDLCYDIDPENDLVEQVLENNYRASAYRCKTCNTILEITLDENHWGSEDIPLIVELYEEEVVPQKETSRPTDFSVEGGRLNIHKSIKVDVLTDIQAAIETMKGQGASSAELTLSLADLQLIRKLLVMDAVNTEMSAYNLNEVREYRKRLKEKGGNNQ